MKKIYLTPSAHPKLIQHVALSPHRRSESQNGPPQVDIPVNIFNPKNIHVPCSVIHTHQIGNSQIFARIRVYPRIYSRISVINSSNSCNSRNSRIYLPRLPPPHLQNFQMMANASNILIIFTSASSTKILAAYLLLSSHACFP